MTQHVTIVLVDLYVLMEKITLNARTGLILIQTVISAKNATQIIFVSMVSKVHVKMD